MRRSGVTVVEVVVVLAVVGLLVALLLPAVQSSRESARAVSCRSNLRQLALSVAAYETTHGYFPPGASESGTQYVSLQGFMGAGTAEQLYPRCGPFDAELWSELAYHRPAGLVCPSDRTGPRHANYAGNFGSDFSDHGFNGIFQAITPARPRRLQELQKCGPVRMSDVIDGAGSTALFAEILVGQETRDPRRSLFNLFPSLQLPNQVEQFRRACRSLDSSTGSYDGWSRGLLWNSESPLGVWYNHVLAPNQPNCLNGTSTFHGALTAASEHPGGVHVAFADGRVQFVSENIDQVVWSAAGSRNGNEVHAAIGSP